MTMNRHWRKFAVSRKRRRTALQSRVYFLHKSQVASLDFIVNMKLFNTSDIEIVKKNYRSYIAYDLPSVRILKRTKRLKSKFLDTVLTTQPSDAV